MSLKPGLGAGFIPEVASAILTHNLDGTLSDVPASLRHGSRVRPLGRYLRRKLREQVGMLPNAPEATINSAKESLLPLSEAAKATAPRGLYKETFKTLITTSSEGANNSLDARERIYKKRGNI